MSKNRNSGFARQASDGQHFSHSAPFVWLEFLRPLMFYPSSDPSFQPGALHVIDWKPSLELLREIFNLICITAELKEEDFDFMPAFRYTDPSRRVAKPGIGIFSRDGVDICDSLNQTVAATLASFRTIVLTGQENSAQEQLFANELPPETHNKILTFAEEFLVTHGGKKVGEARLLKTAFSEILLAGTYRPAKDSPLPPPVKWSVSGEIDGIRGKLRTIYVEVGEKKTISIFFNEKNFKKKLRCKVLDELTYDFEIETEWISREKSVDYLVSFTPSASRAAANQLF